MDTVTLLLKHPSYKSNIEGKVRLEEVKLNLVVHNFLHKAQIDFVRVEPYQTKFGLLRLPNAVTNFLLKIKKRKFHCRMLYYTPLTKTMSKEWKSYCSGRSKHTLMVSLM